MDGFRRNGRSGKRAPNHPFEQKVGQVQFLPRNCLRDRRRVYPAYPDMTVIVEIKTDSRTAYVKSTVLRKPSAYEHAGCRSVTRHRQLVALMT
jgi:hypothetical protein